jgi:uncharacterized protein YjbJ (UPF0337 family)
MQLTFMERDMNPDQVKGKAKEITGKVQQKVGEVTGSPGQRLKGIARQVEGKVQKGVGNATEAVENADRKTRP